MIEYLLVYALTHMSHMMNVYVNMTEYIYIHNPLCFIFRGGWGWVEARWYIKVKKYEF